MPIGRVVKKFIQLESSAGIALFAMAVLALLLDNSPVRGLYTQLFDTVISIQFGEVGLSKPLLLWVNDGFMAIFFLLVGLEIKRELFEGELNTLAKASLPAIAALGGMVVPALIYIGLNLHDPQALKGWAIPTATDIAFSLGILSLLGARVPSSLKIFLMALAIFDDIGAVIIIGFFYSHEISVLALCLALVLLIILLVMNRLKVTNLFAYMLVGIILWVCVLQSGVHATLSGIALGFAIPLRDPVRPHYLPAAELIKALHPWVAFGILPLFAFANAGVSFEGMRWHHFVSTVSIGVALGLFIGKQVGIWGATMLAIKSGLAKMPNGGTSLGIYGIGLVAGVGFTMSLFIGTLAFESGGDSALYAAMVRTGVLLGSLISGVFGYMILKHIYSNSR